MFYSFSSLSLLPLNCFRLCFLILSMFLKRNFVLKNFAVYSRRLNEDFVLRKSSREALSKKRNGSYNKTVLPPTKCYSLFHSACRPFFGKNGQKERKPGIVDKISAESEFWSVCLIKKLTWKPCTLLFSSFLAASQMCSWCWRFILLKFLGF